MSALGEAVLAHDELIGMTEIHALTEARRNLDGQVLTSALIASVVAAAHRQLDSWMVNFEATWRREGKPAQCRAGCNHCCYQPVSVTPSELCLLAEGIGPLDRTPVAARCAAVLDKLDGDAFAAGLRTRRGIPCPLLEHGRCGAYEIRPQACRTHYSMSRYACDREWQRRGRPPSPTDKGVPMPTGSKAAGFAMLAGVDAALVERGLQVEIVELSWGLPIMLAEMPRWLAGEAVFPPDGWEEGSQYSLYLARLLANNPRGQGAPPDDPHRRLLNDCLHRSSALHHGAALRPVRLPLRQDAP